MKTGITVILAVIVIALSMSVFFLKRDLARAKTSEEFYQKRGDDLQNEVMLLRKINDDRDRTLHEISESVAQLERKVELETLRRYVPKKTWDEVSPIIEKLKGIGEESN